MLYVDFNFDSGFSGFKNIIPLHISHFKSQRMKELAEINHSYYLICLYKKTYSMSQKRWMILDSGGQSWSTNFKSTLPLGWPGFDSQTLQIVTLFYPYNNLLLLTGLINWRLYTIQNYESQQTKLLDKSCIFKFIVFWNILYLLRL